MGPDEDMSLPWWYKIIYVLVAIAVILIIGLICNAFGISITGKDDIVVHTNELA